MSNTVTKVWQSTLGKLVEVKFFPRRTPEQIPQSKIIKETLSDYPSPAQFPNLFTLYKRNSWIFSSVNMIVQSCVAVPLRVRDRSTKRIISPTETTEVGIVLKYPNPFMTQMELMERLFLHLEIVGNAFWEMVVQGNKLLAIYPLDPTSMTIIPDARNLVKEYVYSVNGKDTHFAPNEIIHFKYVDPQSEFWGWAPVMVMMRQARLEDKLKTYGEKFFDNDATPSVVLKTDRILSDPTYERLRKRWLERHQGAANKFSVAILEDGMSFEKAGTIMSELDYSAIEDKVRDEITVSSGVPPTLLGIPGVANYASARVAQSMFFDSIIAPRLRKIAMTVDKDIMNRFDRDREAVFDTSVAPINIVKLSANSRVVARLYTLDLMTLDEARNLLGLTPDDKIGDKYKSEVDAERRKRAAASEGGDSSTGADAGSAAEGTQQDPGDIGD
jgi:HK97 family phage portal protein